MYVDEKFRIIVVVAALDEDGLPGDVYEDFSDFKNEHANSQYQFLYCVVDNSGYFPVWFEDWYESVEDAMDDIHKYRKEYM